MQFCFFVWGAWRPRRRWRAGAGARAPPYTEPHIRRRRRCRRARQQTARASAVVSARAPPLAQLVQGTGSERPEVTAVELTSELTAAGAKRVRLLFCVTMEGGARTFSVYVDPSGEVSA